MSGTSYFKLKKTLADTLASIGHPLHADEVVAYILSGLGSEYESLVAALNVKPDLTLDDVYAYMLGYENRQEITSSREVAKATATKAATTKVAGTTVVAGSVVGTKAAAGVKAVAMREAAAAMVVAATVAAPTRVAATAADHVAPVNSVANRAMVPSSATRGSRAPSMAKSRGGAAAGATGAVAPVQLISQR
ncbi:hypothetical protein QYE76_035774 [Lolium multiflorum]|uniref:Uncharacterized protein n=1 Tax=Lolium multiflorum TaxID=4521 RepID=A0AAD8R1I8_LOLMU|nr:hypothetical protein QYE76_035774 [Lolium multiflorum]